jgi:hypothetical protein
MSANLEPKPFSAPEFLGGGVALATVSLIAFGAIYIAQPQKSWPVPKRYASVSIEPSEALARLSLEQPGGATDTAGPTHDLLSSDPRSDTGNSTPSEPNGAKAPRPRPPPADRPVALDTEWPVGPPIQQRGIDADSLRASPKIPTDVFWGLPLSGPLRDASLPNSQQHNVTEAALARAEPTFIGGWTDNIGRCRSSRKAPLVISSHAAKTTSGECDFGFVAREATNRWRVAAICAVGESYWRANIALKLVEPNLTWSSERGTKIYVRCKH